MGSTSKPNLPTPTSNFFVNDFANVIDETTEEKIFKMSKKLYENSGYSAQVVVVTIESLGGYSIEQYANELFNNWGIGSADKDDGVLILLSIADRKSRIEVGAGLEEILTDSNTLQIQNEYMVPYYKTNNFAEGLLSGTEAIINIIRENLEVYDNNIIMLIFSIFGILLIAFLPPFLRKLSYKLATGKKAQKIYDEEFKHKRKKFYIDENKKKIKLCTECGGNTFIRCVKGKYLYSKCKTCNQCYQQISKAYIISRSNYHSDIFSDESNDGFSGGGGSSNGGGSSTSF